MGKGNQDFFEHVKTALDSHEEAYDPQDWIELENRLNPDPPKSGFKGKPLLFSALAGTLILAGAIWASQDDAPETLAETISEPAQVTVVSTTEPARNIPTSLPEEATTEQENKQIGNDALEASDDQATALETEDAVAHPATTPAEENCSQFSSNYSRCSIRNYSNLRGTVQ